MKRLMRWGVLVFLLFYGAKADAQEATEAAPDFFVEAVVDNANPFVGQQITYSLRFWAGVSVPFNPTYDLPDFTDFWQIRKQEQKQSTGQRGGRSYSITTAEVALYPTRSGELTIQPASVTLPETVFRPQETLTTNTVTVQARSLPENAPAGFNGAVGQFEFEAVLDRQSAAVGDPFTLQLTITGTGNLEPLLPPSLPFPDEWRILANPASFSAAAIGEQMIGQKVFTFLIRPDTSGLVTLPAITFTYFDPDMLIYRSIATTAITLDVEPAPDAPSIQATVPPPAVPLLKPLKPLQAVQIRTLPRPAAAFWSLWLLPIIAAAAVLIWRARADQRQRNQTAIRQRTALKRARRNLDAVSKLTDRDEICRGVQRTIASYLGDRLNIPINGQTGEVLVKTAQTKGINPDALDALIACINLTNEGRFAPIGAVDVQSLLAQTHETLTTIDMQWNQQ